VRSLNTTQIQNLLLYHAVPRNVFVDDLTQGQVLISGYNDLPLVVGINNGVATIRGAALVGPNRLVGTFGVCKILHKCAFIGYSHALLIVDC